jgi:hypothetical protein
MECPSYAGYECHKKTVSSGGVDSCPERQPFCPFAQSYSDCLAKGYFWTDEGCQNECLDEDLNCKSQDMVPATQSFLEICLRESDQLRWRGCKVYSLPGISHSSFRSGIPCSHCLSWVCSWEEGHCRDPANELSSETGTTAFDVLSESEVSVEEQIFAWCEERDCITSGSCRECLSRGCLWTDDTCLTAQDCAGSGETCLINSNSWNVVRTEKKCQDLKPCSLRNHPLDPVL